MSQLRSYATPVAWNNEKTQRVFKPCAAKIAKLLTAQPRPVGDLENLRSSMHAKTNSVGALQLELRAPTNGL